MSAAFAVMARNVQRGCRHGRRRRARRSRDDGVCHLLGDQPRAAPSQRTSGLRAPAAVRGQDVKRLWSRAHALLFRLSGGRILGRVGGQPVLLLQTVGRRTGRTAPLPCSTCRGTERSWWLPLTPALPVRPAGIRAFAPLGTPECVSALRPSPCAPAKSVTPSATPCGGNSRPPTGTWMASLARPGIDSRCSCSLPPNLCRGRRPLPVIPRGRCGD